MALRKELNLYANIRPVKIFDSLKYLSPLKPERISGVDFVVVRELTGEIYFGDHILEERKARDINDYSYEEVERIIRKAFEIARNRRKIVTSIDKQNVLATSKLWRKVAEEVAQDFPDVTLEHQLVDSAAMLMITNPAKFDVIVTENLLEIFYLMNQASYLVHLGLCHQPVILKMDQVSMNLFTVQHLILQVKELPILFP